jgi:predicted phage terminase large subunit-like protein
MITVAEQEMLDRLLKINPQIYRQPSQPLGYLVPGLTTWIRKKGLQNNKHIPEWVLQADAKSRLAVLQGLMDSDGTALKNGKLEFSVVNRALADGFKMLACSLGIKVNCSTSVAKLNGRDCGIRYRLQFRTILPVFRLQRKLERMRSTLRGLSLRRFIVAIEPTTSRMVRCITVASENSLYLAGKGFIATHNSWAILLESLRHVIHNTGFYACYFRRNATQVRNPGGLWDESMKLYALAGGEPSVHSLEWVWPRGGRIKFSHLEYDDTVLNWQGSQIALICFDELTHFSASQFWYMLSRNRSMCGVRPYVRATTNPDADSWVAEFISWWIDQNTGLPIVERGGKIRWFIRVNDALVWADSPEELKASYGDQVMPKSVTFIPATIHDNKKLLESDPGYMANLMALDTVERERLLDGNWKIRPAAGMFFKKECVRWYDHKQPPQHLNIYAASDYAVTDGGGDYTELGIFGIDPAQNIFVLDWWYGQTDSSVWIERQIDMIQKWKPIEWIGEAGVIMRALESSINKRMLERKVFCKLRWLPSISNKPTRARAFQARWALGKVYMPMDDQEYPTGLPWAQRLLQQMDNFPTEGAHDDGVDVCSLIGRTIDDLFGAVPPDADAATSKPDDDYGVDEDDYGDWMTA